MNYIQIGTLGKTHGLKGELKLKIDEEYIDDFNEVDVLFVKIKGHYAPCFIESIRSGNSTIIKFEDTNTKEAANELQHKPIFLKEEAVTVFADEPEELLFQHLKGFKIVDNNLGNLGQIKAVEAYPQQEMAVITHNKNEVLIPLNEFIIAEIDIDNQTVLVNLPEGLLEI